MAEESQTVSEIVRRLPIRLQTRFASLSGFVRGVIDEEVSRVDRQIVLDNEKIQLVQLAALVYSLDNFLRSGTNAARSAASTFQEFGLEGFRVGSTEFSPNNANTRRGEELAEELQKTIRQTRLGSLIRNSPTMRELIIAMISELSNE